MPSKKRSTFRRRSPGRNKPQNFSKGAVKAKFIRTIKVFRDGHIAEREVWYHPTKGCRTYRVVEGTQHSLA